VAEKRPDNIFTLFYCRVETIQLFVFSKVFKIELNKKSSDENEPSFDLIEKRRLKSFSTKYLYSGRIFWILRLLWPERFDTIWQQFLGE
jgi:hypothetical protein